MSNQPMSEQPILRPARRNDLATIVALLHDDTIGHSREADADNPAYAKAFEAITANPDTHLYVLELDGTVIGCGQLTVIPGLTRIGMTRALIEGVRIASAQRNNGFGTLFIRELIRQSKEFGCGLVQLTSDKNRRDAHRFYVSLGFTASHEGFKLYP